MLFFIIIVDNFKIKQCLKHYERFCIRDESKYAADQMGREGTKLFDFFTLRGSAFCSKIACFLFFKFQFMSVLLRYGINLAYCIAFKN